MTDHVLEWVINHYVANDVLFADDARRRILEEHSELNTEAFKTQRAEIEKLCSVDYFRDLERKYFRIGPPTVDEGLNPFLMILNNHLCGYMRGGLAEAERLLSQEVNLIDPNNYEAIHELWGLSLVAVLNEENSLLPKEKGFVRMEILYNQVKGLCLPPIDDPKAGIVSLFAHYSQDNELEYLRRTYEEKIPHFQERFGVLYGS